MMTIMKLRMMSILVGCGILILTSGYQIQTTEVDGITPNTKKKRIFPSSDCLIYRLKSRFRFRGRNSSGGMRYCQMLLIWRRLGRKLMS